MSWTNPRTRQWPPPDAELLRRGRRAGWLVVLHLLALFVIMLALVASRALPENWRLWAAYSFPVLVLAWLVLGLWLRCPRCGGLLLKTKPRARQGSTVRWLLDRQTTRHRWTFCPHCQLPLQ